MARPVVVTPQALEGLDARPDHHVLLARDSEQFVRQVERAMDSAIAKKIGIAARKWVLESHKWADSLAEYDRLLALPPQ